MRGGSLMQQLLAYTGKNLLIIFIVARYLVKLNDIKHTRSIISFIYTLYIGLSPFIKNLLIRLIPIR